MKNDGNRSVGPVQFSPSQAKIGAKAILRYLKTKFGDAGREARLSDAYEILSVGSGHSNWNTMSAQIGHATDLDEIGLDEKADNLCEIIQRYISIMFTNTAIHNPWRDRALSLFFLSARILAYSGDIASVEDISEVASLENLIRTAAQLNLATTDRTLPTRLLHDIERYLNTLPGYPAFMETAEREHGYCTSTLVRGRLWADSGRLERASAAAPN